MKSPHFIILSVLWMQGCSLMANHTFVPSNAEAMTEWQVEGSLTIDSDRGEQETFFIYTQIDDDYELALNAKAPASAPKATIKGNMQQGRDSEKIEGSGKDAVLATMLQSTLPLNNMSYWLRALPATENALIKQEDSAITEIKESGWDISYDAYTQIDKYLLPEQLTLVKDETEVEVNVVRAETGFLTSPCPDMQAVKDSNIQNTAPKLTKEQALDLLVPRDGSAPLPRWINKSDFCRQLVKVHGTIPDPRIGLYGPNSMMWKLSAPLAPGGMGAGRALLLQTAHPWITAGIDEHSIVRYDPMERARRTFVNVFTMVYGSMPQVMNSANRVHKTHVEIQGKIPYKAGAFKAGSEYHANEVSAMIWVHSTLWETLVTMYEEIEGPLSQVEKDRFYQETKLFAMLFGIPEDALPRDWNQFVEYNHAMWFSPQLKVTDNAKRLKEDLFTARSVFLIFPLWIQEMVTAAHLPAPIREGYDMNYGLWEQFNNAWLMSGASFANWILPDGLGLSALYHEAHARLKGERVGAYQRMLIKNFLGTDRLVN